MFCIFAHICTYLHMFALFAHICTNLHIFAHIYTTLHILNTKCQRADVSASVAGFVWGSDCQPPRIACWTYLNIIAHSWPLLHIFVHIWCTKCRKMYCNVLYQQTADTGCFVPPPDCQSYLFLVAFLPTSSNLPSSNCPRLTNPFTLLLSCVYSTLF